MTVRVRFAPSPTGPVHIGNIRVAIFNWLFARHERGKFLLRIEDTDLERSTPEAIQTLLDAMGWMGIDYDEEPLYQSAQRGAHEGAVRQMMDDGHAVCYEAGTPAFLQIHPGLFDPSFVTEPGDEVERTFSPGELLATERAILHKTTSPKSGETFVTPLLWDAMTEGVLHLEDGSSITADEIRCKINDIKIARNLKVTPSATPDDIYFEICQLRDEFHKSNPLLQINYRNESDPEEALSKILAYTLSFDLNENSLHELCGGTVTRVVFRRRMVFFQDCVLGRMEKPLDSLRDLAILRGDGSPIFHLANVCDDICQGITHILRGNDHVENTFRHLFLYKALGKTPPVYAHFPMIVNAKGKPYSKRDGDAFVGDYRAKGILPRALFNYLALCGWSPGDDREIMTRQEMVDAFSLERVSASAAQMNPDKLDWMNSQYLSRMSLEELTPLLAKELEAEGVPVHEIEKDWLRRLVVIEKEKLRTVEDFVHRTRFFFQETVTFDEKAVKKFLRKNEGEGLRVLRALRARLAGIPDWSPEVLEEIVATFAEHEHLNLGQVAQPLRVACTGGSVSPGIGDTLSLLGHDAVLARIDHALKTLAAGTA